MTVIRSPNPATLPPSAFRLPPSAFRLPPSALRRPKSLTQRHWARASWFDARAASSIPWGTLAVNVLGGLAIGVAAALIEREGLRLLLITGILGGFTTFSAYSLQTLQSGRIGLALGYACGSVAICLSPAGRDGCWRAGLRQQRRPTLVRDHGATIWRKAR